MLPRPRSCAMLLVLLAPYTTQWIAPDTAGRLTKHFSCLPVDPLYSSFCHQNLHNIHTPLYYSLLLKNSGQGTQIYCTNWTYWLSVFQKCFWDIFSWQVAKICCTGIVMRENYSKVNSQNYLRSWKYRVFTKWLSCSIQTANLMSIAVRRTCIPKILNYLPKQDCENNCCFAWSL